MSQMVALAKQILLKEKRDEECVGQWEQPGQRLEAGEKVILLGCSEEAEGEE